MRIEVFIKNKEVLLEQTQVGRPIADHYCTAHDTYRTEKVLSEESCEALEQAQEKAKELNTEIVVYDMSKLKGMLVARLRGIRSPTWRVVQ
jgi:hypothetical protein